MKRVYIVHCWDGTMDDGWYPWLDGKISCDNVKVHRFNMPDTTHPKIDSWVEALKKEVGVLDENTYFVGHSIGCQTILRYLESENVEKIGGVLLIAPWLDLLEEAIEDEESYNVAYPWLNTPIDFNKIKSKINKVTCIFSSDDYFVSLTQKDKFKELLDAKIIVVKDKGHISEDDNIYELKEIYDELVSLLGGINE